MRRSGSLARRPPWTPPRGRATCAAMPPALIAALVTFVAFLIGLTLPDLDLRLWLGHRSALTHSLLPALTDAVTSWRG